MASADPAPRALVLDLGGGSGRAMLAECGEGGAIVLTELHRFSGYETHVADGPAWDLGALIAGVEAGLAAAAAVGGVASIGVDSWGVDFAVLGPDARPLEPRAPIATRGAFAASRRWKPIMRPSRPARARNSCRSSASSICRPGRRTIRTPKRGATTS